MASDGMRRGVPVALGAVPKPTVIDIVEQTRAIQWWVDEQIAKGRTDEWIEAMLPFAVEFITGRMSEAELLAVVLEAA